MKNKLIYPMVLVAGFGVACGGRNSDSARNAAQQQYETVQEGSAAGVTSTISGPGETLPQITGTNADTTTAFALNPNVAPAGTAPQQAQAVPAYPTGDVPPPMMSSSPSYSPAPARRPAASVPQQTQPAQPVQQAQQPSQPQPAPSEPAEPQPAEPAKAAGPADTDTATTAQPEPPKPAQEPKKEEPPPPPADDTSGTQAEEPPPPPPAG